MIDWNRQRTGQSLCWILTAVWLLVGDGTARAATTTNSSQRILCIFDTYGRDIAPFGATAEACRGAILEGRNPLKDRLLSFGLFQARHPEFAKDEQMAAALQPHVRDGVVAAVAIGEPAAKFVAKQRLEIFPRAPFVFVAEPATLAAAGLVTTNDVVVPFAQNPAGALENILSVLPATTNIAVVIGNSLIEKEWLGKCRAEFGAFTNRVGITYLNRFNFKAMKQSLAKLPPRSNRTPSSSARLIWAVINLPRTCNSRRR